MAATRLIALHINKGKTVGQCLADRTDYSQNAAKTNNGEFISSYECDAKTADEEFLLAKRQYQHITGRQQKHDVIAYQIRQSFKPGEITPEEANEVGRELAMRFLKGNHAFIVATHIDRKHIHNHIIFNSTSLDCSRKFNNFFLSGLAIQRLSDMICLEHGLSVITPKPYKERVKRTVYPKKRSQRDELCAAIDQALRQKPKDFDELVQLLAEMGYEFKDGKQKAFRGKDQKRFLRLRSLGEGYSEDELIAVIAGKSLHKAKNTSKQVHPQKRFSMLIDIEQALADGKSKGYAHWAKKFNRKDLFGDEFTDFNLVFCSSNGKPIEGQVINRAFNKLIEENGLPKVVFHSLRHSSITYKLKLNGGDMKSVQGDSGHAQVKMVADVYSHIIDDDRRLNAERLEAAFYSGRTATPEPVQKVPEVTQDDDTALLMRLLQNPEMSALLKTLAKNL